MVKRVVSMASEEEVTVDRSDTFEVPVIDTVGTVRLRTETSYSDDFAKPAEEIKALDGLGPVFKRRVTNDLKKVRSGTGGAESKVIHEEAFFTGYMALDVIEPPYNLDYLAKIYNSPSASAHYSAVNAKVANIVGLGYKLVENSKTKRNLERLEGDEEKTKNTRRRLAAHRDDVIAKVKKMNKEDEFTEVLQKVWRDYEVTGNGYIEVGRKKDGSIGYIGHIPSQTLRTRRKRDGYVQISGSKVQFFAMFGAGFDDDDKRIPIPNPLGGGTPNEIIRIMKYNPVSGYYGVPDIIPALNAVAGNEFAARFNLDYFENKAIPRHVIILKGAKLGAKAETDVLSFFETALKGQNHRSLYIPLPGDTAENKVELKIEAIEAGIQDASFTNYRRANLSDILMAHRVPITKISVSEGASLSVAKDADKTFKEQVCGPEQDVFEQKINRLFSELTDAFDFELNEMTLTDENTQSQIDERRRKTGTETANEQRIRRGMPAIEGGDELFDMNAATKLAEMADATTRRGQDKSEAQAKAAAAAKPAAPAAGANANGNPAGTRQRDTQRSANATDSAGAGRNPKGEGRTTP